MAVKTVWLYGVLRPPCQLEVEVTFFKPHPAPSAACDKNQKYPFLFATTWKAIFLRLQSENENSSQFIRPDRVLITIDLSIQRTHLQPIFIWTYFQILFPQDNGQQKCHGRESIDRSWHKAPGYVEFDNRSSAGMLANVIIEFFDIIIHCSHISFFITHFILPAKICSLRILPWNWNNSPFTLIQRTAKMRWLRI